MNYMEQGRDAWEKDSQIKEAMTLLETEGISDETQAVDMLVERGFDEATAIDAWHQWVNELSN